jgi:hypothetical protein
MEEFQMEVITKCSKMLKAIFNEKKLVALHGLNNTISTELYQTTA